MKCTEYLKVSHCINVIKLNSYSVPHRVVSSSQQGCKKRLCCSCCTVNPVAWIILLSKVQLNTLQFKFRLPLKLKIKKWFQPICASCYYVDLVRSPPGGAPNSPLCLTRRPTETQPLCCCGCRAVPGEPPCSASSWNTDRTWCTRTWLVRTDTVPLRFHARSAPVDPFLSSLQSVWGTTHGPPDTLFCTSTTQYVWQTAEARGV